MKFSFSSVKSELFETKIKELYGWHLSLLTRPYVVECLEITHHCNLTDPEKFKREITTILMEKYEMIYIGPLYLLDIQKGNDLSFYLFRVRLTEEDRIIKMLPSYMEKYITAPPEEMRDRIRLNEKDFRKVLKDFSDGDSLVRQKNNVNALMNSNFTAHPFVPRGYYDEMKDGVLYVKDSLTASLIRKDEAVILANGQFYRIDKTKNMSRMSILEQKNLICGLENDRLQEEKFKEFAFFDPSSNLYFPYDAKFFKTVLPSRWLAPLLYQTYLSFCELRGIPLIPETMQECMETFPAYITYFAERVQQFVNQNNWKQVVFILPESDRVALEFFTIPTTSPFLPGVTLYEMGLNTALQNNDQKPCIGLNIATQQILWNRNNGLGHNRIALDYDTGTFPYSLMLQVNTMARLKENLRTKNDEGEVLGHLAKVDEVKVSYMMLDHEKEIFDRYEAEHKDALKEFKAKKRKYEEETGNLYQEPLPTKPSSNEPIYLGLELEVMCKGAHRTDEGFRAFIKDVAKSPFGNHVIAKHDGSIGRYGLEIVTVPATLAFHKKIFEEHFFSPQQAFHKRIMATDTCGIHVHISKNAMNASDLRKFIIFINALTNASFINDMAGRAPNTYCKRVAIPSPSSLKGRDIATGIVKKVCKNQSIREGLMMQKIEASHYDAVNIQNAHTIELRIFKSSSDKNRIFRILEFCESLVKFCRSHTTDQMTVYDYVEFVLDKTNKKEYMNVIRWLASKNYIGHTRKKTKDPKTGKVRSSLVHVYSDNKVPFPDSAFHKVKANYPAYYEALEEKTTTKRRKTKCV